MVTDEKISIVIPCYNASKTVDKTIQALLNQNFPKEKIEMIMVDDGSTDNTKEVLSKYAIKYIYQVNAGPAVARNIGWKHTGGQIIFFTDSDCIPEKRWVSKLIERYTANDIGGVGGSYDILNKDNLLADCIHQEIIYRHSKMPPEVDYLGTFNVSYRRSVLEEVDGFEESYKKASGEDNDLAYRVKKAGFKLIFDKDIKVAHHYPESLLKYLGQQFWHGFWRMKMYKDHPDMMKGDVYSGILDFIQPVLSLISIGLFPFIYFPLIKFLILVLILTLFVLQLPLAIAVISKNRNIKYIFLLFLIFLRSYVRATGMLLGIIKFFILG